MTSQTHQAEDKRKPSLQRKPAKPVRQGPVAPAPQPSPHALQEAIADPSHASPADILALQRTAGNRAVTRLIQTKLTVGPAGDKYEQEADRVADQVMSGQPSAISGQPAVQRQAEEEEEVQTKPLAASITPLVQRQAEDEEEIQTFPSPERRGAGGEVQRQAEEEEEVQTFPSPAGRGGRGEGEIQRRADGGFEAGPDVESRLASHKGGGSPLPGEVRATMEPSFGADFGGVRVHTGGEAEDLNRQLSAQAFTHGQDIYMAAGKYAPGTTAGNRLLAHELTHTIQQTGGARLQRRLANVVDTAHLHSFTQKRGAYHVTAGTFTTGRIGQKLNKGDTVDVPTPPVPDVTNKWLKANKSGTAGFIRQSKIEYPPDVNMGNVPLTGGDLKNARRMVYDAAIQALDDVQTTPENFHEIATLRSEFVNERNEADIPNTESLLSRLAHGEVGPLKEIFSKHLPEELAARIAEATGQEEEAAEGQLEAKLVAIINTSDRWRPFAQNISIFGRTYSSKFTPLNQAFSPMLAGRGNAGYASMTAHMPVQQGEAIPQVREQVTNGWYTQFRKGNSVTGDLLFEAFRSGAFSEKGVKDATARQTLARTKAHDLLQAMVIQYVRSQEPAERDLILHGKVPEITVVSTSLLTSFFGALDATILREHADAFESFHGQSLPFTVLSGGQNWPITVRFNIINFNKAVNEFRLMGASRSGQQLEMNARAIGRLKTFKEQGLSTLEQKFTANQNKIDGMAPRLPGETVTSLRTQNQKLRVQIAKIKQLWDRIDSVTARWGVLYSGSGSRYELPALVSNLGYQLGATVHYNCMSGKDRTGMADVEAKLLAFQMDQRVNEAIANGIPLEKAKIVPPYEGAFTELDAEAMAKLIFEGGNLNIQQINTGVAGYKIRGAMKGSVFAGRLDQLASTQRGQQILRQYLGVDDTISVKAKEFSKMVNALSEFTGA